jgi:hypothetical protein
MAIVIRKQGGKWERTDKVIFADEAQLQKLLYESPELIPTKVEDQAAVFTREAGLPGSGFTDLVGVDARGNILVVETKLARNDEIRRKVIGQVLEYAAYLWGMSFDGLDRFFLNREGKSLLDLLIEKDAAIDKDWLRQNVEQNLASGTFQLIIAVDAINPELEKIIAYVSSRGSGLQLEALELELYKQGQVEILVPQRYGQLNQPKESQSSKKILSFDEVVHNCSDDHSRNLLSLLGEMWKAADNYIKPGTVGASFQAQIGSKSQPIFWAYPDCLQNALGDISKRGAPSIAFKSYRQAIAKLPGFNREEVLNKSQPMTKFSRLTEDAVKAFIAESQTLVDAWKKSLET